MITFYPLPIKWTIGLMGVLSLAAPRSPPWTVRPPGGHRPSHGQLADNAPWEQRGDSVWASVGPTAALCPLNTCCRSSPVTSDRKRAITVCTGAGLSRWRSSVGRVGPAARYPASGY
jgi:hypothetical protein